MKYGRQESKEDCIRRFAMHGITKHQFMEPARIRNGEEMKKLYMNSFNYEKVAKELEKIVKNQQKDSS